MEKKKTNIVIVGAGKGGVSFLNMFHQDEFVNILGIVDKNPEAQGMMLAQKLNIPTFNSWKEIIKDKKLDEIIDVSGNEKVFNTLLKEKPEQVGLMDGPTAKMLWLILDGRRKIENEKHELFLNLGERVKELNCLYSLSQIIETKNISLEQILKQTVNIIPSAFQYPDIACAKIVFEDKEYRTQNFQASKWSMSAKINVFEDFLGLLEVCYLKERPQLDIGPFLKEEGNLLGALAERLGRVAERNKSTVDLRKAKYKMELIYKIIPSAIFTVDKERKITSWNDKAKEITGFSADEVIGKECLVFADLPCKEKCGLFSDDVIKPVTGKQCTIKTKDGRLRVITKNTDTLKDSQGNVIGGIESFEDITENKIISDEIKRIAEEWDRTFNAMSDLVFIQDKDFTITKVNKAMADALKKRPDEIIGRKCYEVLHNRNQPWPECPLEKTKGDHKSHAEEVDDPNIGVPLLVTTSPIFDQNGKFIGSVHVAKDVSRTKKSEKEIAAAKEELEIQTWGLNKTNEAIKVLYKELEEKTRRVQELDKLKSEFISTVSHELRTPLSITKEGISLVLDRIPGEINQKQERLLITAKDNIDRLARIINSLLDISKIEAGKLELRRDLVNLFDLIKLIVSSFGPKASKKELELITTLPAKGKTEVYADPDKIIQVLTNLVNNALKFTEKGSIEIKVEDEEKILKCSIIDTGVGIAQEDLPKVFSKFQQFGRTEGGGDRGTGLGLSIAKGLVEMHHGEIWVESELGKGAKFIFTLPKYTTENIIKENLTTLIDEVTRKSTELSLIIISVVDFERVEEGLSKAKMKSIFQKMTEQIKNSLRQVEDMAFCGLDEIAVILPGSNKENALRIEGRLMQVLDDYLNQQNLSSVVKLKFGHAVFPDEAATEEDLIKKARK